MKPFVCWSDRYADILACCRDHFAGDLAHSMQVADEVCANTFLFGARWEMEPTHIPVTFADGNIDWEAMPDGDIEWIYALNRHTYFVDMGRAYQATGDEKYPAAFVRLLEHWWANTRLCDATTNTTWRTLESGLRAEFWLRALEMMRKSPAVTDEFVARLEKSLEEHGEYLAGSHNAFHTLSNWGVIQDHGLLLIGLALGRADWAQLALQRMDREIEVQVLADGVQWEQSPMYHCEVLHCCLDAIFVARRFGMEIPARFEGAVRGMVYALGAWLTPDRVMPAHGDSDFIFAKDMLVCGALLFRDGQLKTMAGEGVCFENLWDFGPEADELYAAVPTAEVPCSIALTDSGNYTLRSGWDEDASWLRFHCGCMGSGHGHADQLHIDWSAFGQRILIDPGRFTYVSSPIRVMLKQAVSHNTTTVDDTEFTECVESWGYNSIAQAVKGEFRFTPDADYLSGGHLGYLGLPGGAVFPQRKIVYLKPDVFVVFDAFYGPGEHSYQQRFLFDLGGQAAVDGQSAVFRSKKATARILCLGEGLELSMGRTSASPQYNHMQLAQQLTVRRSGEGVPGFVTVLAAAKGEQEPDITAELAPVWRLPADIQLPGRMAQAVRIVKDGEETVVVLEHEDINNQVEVRLGQNYRSYGRVLVFDKKHPGGLCLAW